MICLHVFVWTNEREEKNSFILSKFQYLFLFIQVFRERYVRLKRCLFKFHLFVIVYRINFYYNKSQYHACLWWWKEIMCTHLVQSKNPLQYAFLYAQKAWIPTKCTGFFVSISIPPHSMLVKTVHLKQYPAKW